jgi:hypothetical protein
MPYEEIKLNKPPISAYEALEIQSFSWVSPQIWRSPFYPILGYFTEYSTIF